MKSLIGPGLIAGFSLVFALAATAQTPTDPANQSLQLPTQVHAPNAPENSHYDYDFISKGYVWSNKPLTSTATKVCKTMKVDHGFAETPYAISSDKDFNSCLDMQIRSIGYMRWLKNNGFKANKKNRKYAQAYLKQNYAMGPWGGYTFAQLSEATKTPLPASHK